MEDKILVTRPSMPPFEEYVNEIKSLWDSHWITNMGTYHQQLEEKLKNYLEVPSLSLMVMDIWVWNLQFKLLIFPRVQKL